MKVIKKPTPVFEKKRQGMSTQVINNYMKSKKPTDLLSVMLEVIVYAGEK
ncbi:MAG: hypothetical protein JJD98_05060 [Polaromonas sp.]|nr:hypothetical protein [Polaromonas sp.]